MEHSLLWGTYWFSCLLISLALVRKCLAHSRCCCCTVSKLSVLQKMLLAATKWAKPQASSEFAPSLGNTIYIIPHPGWTLWTYFIFLWLSDSTAYIQKEFFLKMAYLKPNLNGMLCLSLSSWPLTLWSLDKYGREIKKSQVLSSFSH